MTLGELKSKLAKAMVNLVGSSYTEIVLNDSLNQCIAYKDADCVLAHRNGEIWIGYYDNVCEHINVYQTLFNITCSVDSRSSLIFECSLSESDNLRWIRSNLNITDESDIHDIYCALMQRMILEKMEKINATINECYEKKHKLSMALMRLI